MPFKMEKFCKENLILEVRVASLQISDVFTSKILL